jgi:hypothetical protein
MRVRQHLHRYVSARRLAHAVQLMAAAHWSPTMAVPYYISEDKSEMRAIKPGWYAIDDDGDLSSGPFSSRAECLSRMTQNGSTPSMLRLPPK